MRIRAFHPLTFLLYTFIPTILAIYADEAYQVDYHHPLLGRPRAQTSFFLRPSKSNAALIYSLSERNVLGAVNPKDGNLLWRHRLGDDKNQSALNLLKAGDRADTIFSAVKNKLQAWDALDGRMAWSVNHPGKVKALEILAAAKQKGDILVAYEDGQGGVAVQRRASSTGDIQWTYQDAAGSMPIALLPSEGSVYYLGLHAGRLGSHKVGIHQLDLETGKSSHQPVLPSDSEIYSEESVLFAGNNAGTPLLIWTDKAFKSVKINVVGTKQVMTVNITPSSGEVVQNIRVHSTQADEAQSHFLIHYQTATSHWAEVFHVSDTDSKCSRAYGLPVIEGKGAFSVSTTGTDVYFARYSSNGIELVSSLLPDVLARWDMQKDSQDVKVDLRNALHATSEVLSKAGKYSLRSALALANGDWALVRNGELLWIRPESLAGAVAAGFVDSVNADSLLEDLATESHSSVMNAYFHRVKRHAKQLQYFPGWLQTLPELVINSFKSEDQRQSNPSFGFNKIAIVATSDGRVAALEAGHQGRVLWNIEAVQIPNGEKWRVLSIEAEGETVLIRALGGEFLRVHAKSGVIQAYQQGALISSLRTTTPVSDAQGRIQMIPVNVDGSLGAIPHLNFRYDTIIVTKGDDHVLRGWALKGLSQATLAWQFVPNSGEVIRDVHARPLHDPVASIGKALGDRNVLYKYLNPNIVLITTVNVKASAVSLFILDATSGAVLYSAHHTDVDTSLPISSTLTENFFAYSLFAGSSLTTSSSGQDGPPAPRGYRLVVSEIFESSFPNDRGPFGGAANFSAVRPFVSTDDEETGAPYVITQTFLIPGPISYMTTTSTLQGITPRALICALPNLNALISIPRNVLDPRRPVGRDPTALEAEEGLFRYSPMLDFEPKWMVTHKRDLLTVSDVVTSPSKLESTSLVFAVGELDIFGTRISPIGSFDMLGKGFSKLQLVGTVVALAVGTSLLAPFVRRKQIDGLWQA